MSGWNQEQEFQAGVCEERERIIKLLEANNRCANELGHAYVADCYCEAIALIKGEENA